MERQKSLLLGVGLDNEDGHTRVTSADHAVVVGGSQETHERMQECVIRVGEHLERKGKSLDECHREEVADIIRSAVEEC